MAILLTFVKDDETQVTDAYGRIGRVSIDDERSIYLTIDFYKNLEVRKRLGGKVKQENINIDSPQIRLAVDNLIKQIYIKLKTLPGYTQSKDA